MTNKEGSGEARRLDGWLSDDGRFGVFYAVLNDAGSAARPWHACDATLDVHGDLAMFGHGFATRDEAIAACASASATPPAGDHAVTGDQAEAIHVPRRTGGPR